MSLHATVQGRWVSGPRPCPPCLSSVLLGGELQPAGLGDHVGTKPSVLGCRLAKALTTSTTSPWLQETLRPSCKGWEGWEVKGSREHEKGKWVLVSSWAALL